MKFGFSQQVFVKYSNIKFSEIFFQFEPSCLRQRDIMLIVALCSCALSSKTDECGNIGE
jgi:hypothetical protein